MALFRPTLGGIIDHIESGIGLEEVALNCGLEHDHDPLPILVAGGASGRLKGDRHIVTPAHTPMSNLMLSVLDTFGVHQDSFGDRTGLLEI